MNKIAFVIGTRPDAIKMAPIILRFKKDCHYRVLVINSAQHKEMLKPILNLFGITPDIDLDCMLPNQNLATLSARVVERSTSIFAEKKPDMVFVQGDTTTSAMAALAAFYNKIPVCHVEAGLRTYNRYSPFPEEINRQIIGRIAEHHFAPTPKAKENLLNEGILPKKILVCGNSAIDALLIGLGKIDQQKNLQKRSLREKLGIGRAGRIVLVTGHRRENFGQGLRHICEAILQLSRRFPDLSIVYPVHLNPNVKKPVFDLLGNKRGIILLPPLDYADFILLMRESYLILSDSGGIQEEAPALGKPVLVMRENTERPEGIEAGTALLVGTDKKKIVVSVSRLLADKALYTNMSRAGNPYGNGTTAKKIYNFIAARQGNTE